MANLHNLQAGLTTSSHEVHVTIPAAMHYNIEAMHRVTRQVLSQLGCEACHSGFDIRFDVVRQFVADEKGNLQTPSAG